MPHRNLVKTLAVVLFFAALVAPGFAGAQAVSYVDESGTVHFADRLEQVPERYRTQIVKPTPRVLSKKEYQKELKKYERIESDKKREEQRKAREKEREKKKLAQQQKKNSKREKKEKHERYDSPLADGTREMRPPRETPTPAPISR